MQPMYYIGLDVHKKKISYCVKDGSGQVHREGENCPRTAATCVAVKSTGRRWHSRDHRLFWLFFTAFRRYVFSAFRCEDLQSFRTFERGYAVPCVIALDSQLR